ncbi:MAG: dipeptide ABC transporter ATP-binding protein [Chitinophagaceae bacterium]
MSTILSINQLSISFTGTQNTFRAVQNLSFSIRKGEWVALVGESGSGKSVTALSILQLLDKKTVAYEGEIVLHTKNNRAVSITNAGEKEMGALRGKEAAMIFQEPMTSLNPLLTCGEQIIEAMIRHQGISHTQAREKAIALCRKVELPEPEKIIHKYPHEISGGQKQRVMIALAVSCGPSLLICDEPTTALDYDVQRSIVALLRQLQQEQELAILFITHDLGLVENTADRILVMYKGKLVENNTTRAIFNDAEHPYTRALLACRPVLYAKGTPLPNVQQLMEGKEDHPEQSVITPVAEQEKDVLLAVKNLSVLHHRTAINGKRTAFKAVDAISFDVFKGETVGLTGPSGCGKTTTGRALLHLVTPEKETEIQFEGKDITQLGPAQWKKLRRKMQLIFQDPYSSLNPSKTVGSLLEEPMLVHGIFPDRAARKKRVLELLDRVQLPASSINKYPHEFSGGQRQRISIARALSLEPAFIVCDESVSALDVSVQAQVLNLLNALKAQFNLTLLFISHDREVVRYFCDRILRMEKGKLV